MPPVPSLAQRYTTQADIEHRDVGKGCITAELIDPDELVAGIITRERDERFVFADVPSPYSFQAQVSRCLQSSYLTQNVNIAHFTAVVQRWRLIRTLAQCCQSWWRRLRGMRFTCVGRSTSALTCASPPPSRRCVCCPVPNQSALLLPRPPHASGSGPVQLRHCATEFQVIEKARLRGETAVGV